LNSLVNRNIFQDFALSAQMVDERSLR